MYKSIYFLMIASLLINEVISDNFCTDVDQIDGAFFLSDYNYLMKASNVYKYKCNTSLTGLQSQGSDLNTHFSVGEKLNFKSVNTGFLISKIPECDTEDPECDDMKKLLNMGFVIGYTNQDKHQVYIAYRLNQTLTPITDEKEMPFLLKPRSQINYTLPLKFWPLKAKEGKTVYRHSAYIESRFELIHFISIITTETIEYCYFTTIDKYNWMIKWKRVVPKLSGSHTLKPFTDYFYGLLQSKGAIYAIVMFKGDKKQTLLSYKGNASFLEENLIDIRNEIYGCSPVTTTEKEDQKWSSSFIIILMAVLLIIVLVVVIVAVLIYGYCFTKSEPNLKDTEKGRPKEPIDILGTEPKVRDPNVGTDLNDTTKGKPNDPIDTDISGTEPTIRANT